MNNMEIKIKEVEQYFKDQLYAGNFEVKDIDSYIINVSISGYEFNFWMSNGSVAFGCYYAKYNFIHLSFNDEEKILYYNILNDKYRYYITQKLISQKEQELEILKNNIL